MLASICNFSPLTVIKSKVVIVGAGPAGITVAKELASKGIESLILESGNFSGSGQAQLLNEGEISVNSLKHQLPQECRERRVGGATNSWGGACVPLDRCDFESSTGSMKWPIDYDDLSKLYSRANKYFGIESQLYKAENLGPVFNRKLIDSSFNTQFFQANETRKKFADLMHVGDLVEKNSLLTDSTVTEIILNKDLSSVDFLEVTSIHGEKYKVKGDYYVLAAGGLENPRILLNSNRQIASGVSNSSGLIGRFYTPHVNFTNGIVSLFDGVQAITSWVRINKKNIVRPYFRPSDGLINDFDLLNSQVTLKSLLSNSINKALRNDFINLTANYIASNNLESFFNESTLDRQYLCYWSFDQTPNINSRIYLSNDVDFMGQRKITVEHQVFESDFYKYYQCMKKFGNWLLNNRLGILVLDKSLEELPNNSLGQGHSIGATRMGDTSMNGVVDMVGRSFDVPNLFIVGSSIFPSGGQANPTYTLVALAIATSDEIIKYH